MASRQNRTGRRDGYGDGPLSRVYGKAERENRRARREGRAPGEQPMTDTQKRMATLDAANARRDARASGGVVAPQPQVKRGPVQRGMGAEGAKWMADRTITAPGEMSAPGLEDLTGGGPVVSAPLSRRPPPRQPRRDRNQPNRPAVTAPRPRNQPVVDHAALSPQVEAPAPVVPYGMALGLPNTPQPDTNIAADVAAPAAPAERSIRSQGMRMRDEVDRG